MDNLVATDTTNRYENEKLILSILKEYYPSLDVGPGTPFYEQVIRPNAFLWSKHSDGLRELFLSNSLAAPGAIAPEDLDRLMTRYFEERKIGRTVYGVIRIIFNTKKNYSIAANTAFTASGERVYLNTRDIYLNSDQLVGDEATGYVVDLEVYSDGTSNKYNGKANETINPPSELKPYVLKCFFATDTSDGGIQETNMDFYNRAKGGLTLKNLTTYRGVKKLTKDSFNIKDLVVVGVRDPEMRRDLYELPSESGVFTVHRGGMSDIYVRNDPYVVVSGYQAPLGFPYSLNGVSIVDQPDALMNEWNALQFKNVDHDIRGSIYEVLPISTQTRMSSLTSSIQEVQDFMSDVDYEAIHSENLVKQMWPIVVRGTIRISGGNSSAVASAVQESIVRYVNSLLSGMYPQVGNIVNAAKQAGALYVHTPMELSAYYIKENLVMEKIGLNMVHYPENSLLMPVESDSLMFTVQSHTQMSIRTCFFYTNKDLIRIEVV